VSGKESDLQKKRHFAGLPTLDLKEHQAQDARYSMGAYARRGISKEEGWERATFLPLEMPGGKKKGTEPSMQGNQKPERAMGIIVNADMRDGEKMWGGNRGRLSIVSIHEKAKIQDSLSSASRRNRGF